MSWRYVNADPLPGQQSVTDVAIEHGFWHFGRFSVKYRAMFGELPSTTLHRRPGSLRIPGQ